MTPAQIISIAQARTKKRGATTLDVTNELLMVIQDLCGLARWDWRKKITNILLTIGTQAYDMNASGVDMQDLEEIETVNLALAPTDVKRIVRVFDHNRQAAIRASTDTGEVANYFRASGAPNQLVVHPRADGTTANHVLEITYWAIPPGPLDPGGTLVDTVPLVPAYLHRALVKGLEAQILRYTLGEDNVNYTNAQAEYTAQVSSVMPQAVSRNQP